MPITKNTITDWSNGWLPQSRCSPSFNWPWSIRTADTTDTTTSTIVISLKDVGCVSVTRVHSKDSSLAAVWGDFTNWYHTPTDRVFTFESNDIILMVRWSDIVYYSITK